MKKNLLLLFVDSLCAFAGNATVYTVDNNVPSGGQYTTLNAAQTAASAGDTLYISGSPYSYGNFAFTKSLVLIGTGHNPQNDNKQVSTLNNISFDNSVAGSGSKLIGININDYYTSGNMANWSILRCRIRNVLYMNTGTMSDVLVEGNVFDGSIYNNVGYIWLNVTFRNNVFSGSSYVTTSGVGSSFNILFVNNLFLVDGNAFYGGSNALTINNNIFYRANPVANVSSSSFSNNVIDPANTATFSGSNNSYTGNFQADPQFVSYPTAGANFDYSHNYHLQATSTLLINKGTDGKDIGITGGNGYFDRNGIPPIPQIRKFDIITPANGIVSPGGSITIDLRSTIKQ